MNFAIEMLYSEAAAIREEVMKGKNYKFTYGKMYALLWKKITKKEENLIAMERRIILEAMTRRYQQAIEERDFSEQELMQSINNSINRIEERIRKGKL
jgi:hypothetical protein